MSKPNNNKIIIEKLSPFVKKIDTDYINTREMEQFIVLIQDKHDVIIDIRNNVYNKANQGYSPIIFKLIMKLIKKEYFRFQKLGNPFHENYSKEQYREAKEGYLNYLKNDKHAKQEFKRLFQLINSSSKRFCLICYCDTEDARYCHRFWLYEELVKYKRYMLGFPPVYKYEK